MQKLLAICYAILILFQSFNINFEDVAKLGALVEHASYHYDTYGDSFAYFISEHYGDASVAHSGQHKEHENLPFKHNSCVHVHATFTMQSLNFTLANQSFTEIPVNFHYSESTSLFERHSVFQPPRLA